MRENDEKGPWTRPPLRRRVVLGKSQRELAGFWVCRSRRVESYEQGWRSVPSMSSACLLFLFKLNQKAFEAEFPCWGHSVLKRDGGTV
jgi:hypothetical protein